MANRASSMESLGVTLKSMAVCIMPKIETVPSFAS
jgi:hypothetical protein